MLNVISRLISHVVEHPMRLAATNAGVLGVAHFAPQPETLSKLSTAESSAKILLVLVTALVTGLTGWQKWRGRASVRHALKPIRLLMVDDNPDDCILFARAFRRHHCDVTTVQSHASALAELRSERRYDFVLIDARMPEGGPADIFRQIRLERPRIGVGIFSSVIDNNLIEGVSKFGFATFMLKPTAGVAEFVEELVSSLRVRS